MHETPRYLGAYSVNVEYGQIKRDNWEYRTPYSIVFRRSTGCKCPQAAASLDCYLAGHCHPQAATRDFNLFVADSGQKFHHQNSLSLCFSLASAVLLNTLLPINCRIFFDDFSII